MLTGAACHTGKKGSAGVSDTRPTKEDIKVGAIFDLSGPTADTGIPYSEGIRDYVDYRNTQGGVEGHKLALTGQDYGYKVTAAGPIYAQDVSQGAKVFMGWASADTEALRPKVNADMIPFMSAALPETLADPAVTPYNFFASASYSQQLRVALRYIADQNRGRHVEVAVFYSDSPSGVSPLEDGKKYIVDEQLDIGFKNYAMPATASDYLAQIGQASAQKARYIIVQNAARAAARLAGDLAGQKSTVQLVCLNLCADDLFVKLAGPAAEKMIGVMPFAPPAAGGAGLDEINNFLKAKNTTAQDKGLYYVQGWYTMAVMAEGIANALKANSDKVDGPSIKAGLERITDFKTGVTDPISFSSASHAGLMSAGLYQVENGSFKKISDPIKVAK
jgi:branched-chain amino acid transport system substrate-binding protein